MKNKTLKQKLRKEVRGNKKIINAQNHRIRTLETMLQKSIAELDGRKLMNNILATMLFGNSDDELAISSKEMQKMIDCELEIYFQYNEKSDTYLLKLM